MLHIMYGSKLRNLRAEFKCKVEYDRGSTCLFIILSPFVFASLLILVNDEYSQILSIVT